MPAVKVCTGSLPVRCAGGTAQRVLAGTLVEASDIVYMQRAVKGAGRQGRKAEQRDEWASRARKGMRGERCGNGSLGVCLLRYNEKGRRLR